MSAPGRLRLAPVLWSNRQWPCLARSWDQLPISLKLDSAAPDIALSPPLPQVDSSPLSPPLPSNAPLPSSSPLCELGRRRVQDSVFASFLDLFAGQSQSLLTSHLDTDSGPSLRPALNPAPGTLPAPQTSASATATGTAPSLTPSFAFFTLNCSGILLLVLGNVSRSPGLVAISSVP